MIMLVIVSNIISYYYYNYYYYFYFYYWQEIITELISQKTSLRREMINWFLPTIPDLVIFAKF